VCQAPTLRFTTIPLAAGTSGVSETATIAAGAAKTFDQKTGSSTKNCDDLADGSGKFVGRRKDYQQSAHGCHGNAIEIHCGKSLSHEQ